MSRICDQLVESDQLLRIDKLEIDIGTIPIDKLESSLKEEIVKQFKNQVLNLVAKNPSILGKTTEGLSEDFQEEPKSKRAESRQIEVLMYFFEFGSLPWWQSIKETNIKEITENLISESPILFYNRILPLLVSNQIRSRIAETLTYHQLLSMLNLDEHNELKLIWKELIALNEKGLLSPSNISGFKRDLLKNALSLISLDDSDNQKVSKLKFAIIHTFKQLRPKLFLDYIKTGKPSIDILTDKNRVVKLFKEFSQDKEIASAKDQTENEQVNNDLLIKELPGDDFKETKTKSKPGTVFIEINNAGIVLLWPYLEMFFNELGLLENKDFKDEQSRWKAVHLLHFLCFGATLAEEHEWALNKVLCGIALSDFVPAVFELNPTEIEECNNMLQSVVNNWKALKSTSIEGLQQAFLRRNGLLKGDQNGFLVEIEKTALDVLLTKLTWPISVIRLPWNDRLIHVKW